MATVLTLVGLVLLPRAPEVLATGANPGFNIPIATTGPTVTGVLVVDTHMGVKFSEALPQPTCVTTTVVLNPPPFDPTFDKTTLAPSVTCVPDTGGVTEGPKAKYGSIRLKKGTSVAGAIFRLPTDFKVNTGCNANLTGPGSISDRFGAFGGTPHDNGLRAWIPINIVDQLLTDLGIDPTTAGEPVVTGFSNIVCTADPQNPGPLAGGANPGILSADIVIHFVK